MIARGIGGATPLPTPHRPEGTVRAQIDGPATVHLSVPFTSVWKLALNGQDVAARPAFGLTNAYDVANSGEIEISFVSSVTHTISILVQFVAWCLVVFVALSRRRRTSSRTNMKMQLPDGPVIVMNEGATP
jgi:hypothetical protein